MASTYYTYEIYLRKLCNILHPRNILEWGPGRSTCIMHEECPDANILSIEHDKLFYNKAQIQHKDNKKINIIYVNHTITPAEDKGYTTYPVRKLLPERLDFYDLIFIDGRSRCDCLCISFLLLSSAGVVVLHDSNRVNYHPGLEIFPFFYNNTHKDVSTAVATKSPQRNLEINDLLYKG